MKTGMLRVDSIVMNHVYMHVARKQLGNGGQKLTTCVIKTKHQTLRLSISPRILIDFQNSFTATLTKKFNL